MENRFFNVVSQKNPAVTIRAAEGHFATGSSHISHYIDISELKSSAAAAKGAARELAAPYINTDIDVIVYMEGAEIIAAYIADEFLHNGANAKEGREIHIVTPMNSSSGHFIFHENMQRNIKDKNVMLLVASMSTGSTVKRAIECLSYYGGKISGISAIFSAFPEVWGSEVHSLFTILDIPDYHFEKPFECSMCKHGRKLDAIVNSEGYTKI